VSSDSPRNVFDFKRGDIAYTVIDPEDPWGLKLTDRIYIVILWDIEALTNMSLPGDITIINAHGKFQKISHYDLHFTVESAKQWINRFAGLYKIKE
jgi:hypothetical protein